MRPTTRLFACLGLSTFALTAACAAPLEEEAAEDRGELRNDPASTVATTDPNVRLVAGYNALLDRATTAPCAEPTGALRADVGGVEGGFTLSQIKTKDELAKELEVSLSLSGKAPAVEVTAAASMVRKFKESTTKVTFLLRDVRSYTVTNRTPLAFSADAAKRLSKPEDFLLKCGGSYAQAIVYQAQVAVMLRFEAKSVEEARSIETSVGVTAPGVPVSGTAGLKTKIAKLAQEHTLTVDVSTSGFNATPHLSEDMETNTVAKFDAIRDELSKSIDADVQRDLNNGYFANELRAARPASVVQASYAGLPNAPQSDAFVKITNFVGDAERFYNRYASLQVKLESVYHDELQRFLGDSKNQFRYNHVEKPLLTTPQLVQAARARALGIGPDVEGNVTWQIREVAQRCLRDASNGDYSACAQGDRERWDLLAESVLSTYQQTGRIAEMVAYMPQDKDGANKTFSYRNASPACSDAGMRLATPTEMRWLAPMVNALATPKGEVWVATDSTSKCAAPYFANGANEATLKCETSAGEALPYVVDRPVICVPAGGPVPPMSRL